MKVIVLYLRILERVEPSLPVWISYEVGERRFLQSYKLFRPDMPHELLVINCCKANDLRPWDDVVTRYGWYGGFGSDCGTFQAIGQALDCELVVCFNSLAYLWRPGWLEPLANARHRHGPGVYGPTASYEVNPHLRTPCIAFDPMVLRNYPILIDTREKAAWFEHGPENVSLWAHRQGLPSLMVTDSGEYPMNQWRSPANIFRRGNQSACLVRDRHLDIYDSSTPAYRTALERSADGKK